MRIINCRECYSEIAVGLDALGRAPRTRRCPSCARRASRANEKKWVDANREKVRARERQRYASSIENQRKKNRAYHANNRRRMNEKSRIYRQANLERMRKLSRDWHSANIKKDYVRNAARRAQREEARPKWANAFFMEEIYDLARRRTLATGMSWHVDHIVPLRNSLVCGLHVEHNLRVIPSKENMAKGNRYWPDMPNEIGA